MCLGLPGQIVAADHVEHHSATVDVSGVQREVNVGLLVTGGETVSVGDWVLVHVGFAMAKIDEDEAKATLELVKQLGGMYDDELAEFGG
ncbi:HypC/HybG/HupF family hydrogenase formation chaperone [soil metagenome]